LIVPAAFFFSQKMASWFAIARIALKSRENSWLSLTLVLELGKIANGRRGRGSARRPFLV